MRAMMSHDEGQVLQSHNVVMQGATHQGSVSAKTGEANGAAYAASKFGLIGFTQSLYEEVREQGIEVAVILPGFVDTPLIAPNRQLDRSKMIQADDIAQVVNYVLTSPAICCPVEITVRPLRTPYR